MALPFVTSLRRTAAALLVVLVWSACFVVIRVSSPDAPPLLYGALRALLGGLPLLAVAAAAARGLPPAGTWRWLVVLGLTNTTLGLAGMFLSAGTAGAAVPGVLANSQALLVAPFAALLFGDPLTGGRLAGIVVGLAGVALTLPQVGSALGSLSGAIMALVSAAGLAAGTLVTKHIARRVDALTATAWQYVLGGLVLLGWSLGVEEVDRVVWSSRFAAGLLFLGLVGSAGASWIWYHLLRDGEVIALSALTLLTPAFALLLAVLVAGERPGARVLFGITVVLAGAVAAGWPKTASPAEHGDQSGGVAARHGTDGCPATGRRPGP